MQNNHNSHKLKIALCIIIGLSFLSNLKAQTYKIDAKKSEVNFSITHMGVLTVNGAFYDFLGQLIFIDDSIKKIESIVYAKSIDTKDKKRDRILKGDPYFDVEKYPEIIFNSIRIDSKLKTITGILKIKQVAKTITMSFYFEESLRPLNPKLKLSTTIDRNDFNLDFGTMNALVGNKVKIEIVLSMAQD